jgi:hypothetical protein
VNKMNMTNKVVFELKKQVLAFKTIREWSEWMEEIANDRKRIFTIYEMWW